MRLGSQIVFFSGAGLATAVTISAVVVAASHVEAGPPVTAADDLAASVETFDYPGAEQVLEQQHVKLIAGDGYIVLADCTTPPVDDVGVLKVYSTDLQVGRRGQVCFKVRRDIGYLKLEMPAVYSIRGDGQTDDSGHKVTAIVKTEDGVLPPVEVNPSEPTPIGIGQDEGNKETMLLELRARP